ncbi:MAG: DUF192 domain-containing protein [Patescibacteria group bacterium]|nr:DUF192 domain-containing protein [Patescibacteria group bacterium]MDD5164550.1 DUF192 domain-containing protein [Patescibacteria group bacterium]MDD5534325.1 DUF192 domain-containing protein [Patescibacteria group bacterium]
MIKNKKILWLICVIILLILIIILIKFSSHPESTKVCFKDNCFQTVIARTPPEMAKGLMNQHLKKNGGMLFVFKTPVSDKFWMKNTLEPLDIIWLDENKQVIFISKNTPICEKDPCPNYGTEQKSLYVLEIKGGATNQIGLNIGDKLDFSL